MIFEGDAGQCSEFLEVDRNLYAAIKECGKPNNEEKCIEQLKAVYAGSGIGKLLNDIESAVSEIASEVYNKVAECTETVDNLEQCALQAGVSQETLNEINRCTESGGALEGCFNNFASDIGSDISDAIPLANCPSGEI